MRSRNERTHGPGAAPAAAFLALAVLVAADSPRCGGSFVRQRIIVRDIRTGLDAAAGTDAARRWAEGAKKYFRGNVDAPPGATFAAAGVGVVRAGGDRMDVRYAVTFKARDSGISVTVAIGPSTENYRLRAAVEGFVGAMLDDFEAFLKKDGKVGN